MMQSKKSLLIALLIPILSLFALTVYKNILLSVGQEIVLPISGYDPRDLLSGHYLVYRIDYNVGAVCAARVEERKAYICLEPKGFFYEQPDSCKKLIRGFCRSGRFEAGVEKFFVPDSRAQDIENMVRSKSASIVLSVTADGQAQVKDLLIDGKPWQDK